MGALLHPGGARGAAVSGGGRLVFARRVREVVTPEGVPLRFEVGDLAARAGALGIDVLIVTVAVVFALLPFTLAGLVVLGPLAAALALVVFFGMRSFYFTLFEARWHGSTPGKRMVGLRVIDAQGGPLTAEAVFARNLMRELELFAPAVVLLAPESALPDLPGFARLLSLAWLAVPVLVPLMNRDRLRAGDVVAGTLVVHVPAVRLLADLGEPVPAPRRAPPPLYTFTPEQLDVYGIYELHVLETLLRETSGTADARLAAVAERIRSKIDWRSGPQRDDPEAFLRAFYAAQRARLEQRLVLGERRERKRDVNRTP